MLRPMQASDAVHVRRIFRETIAFGRPLPDDPEDFDVYEDLAIGWYLGPGLGSAAVAESDGRIVGYVLVCTDRQGHDRWQRRHAVRFLRRVLPKLALRRYPPFTDRFYRLRIRDGWELWRHAPRDRADAHAHFNLSSGARRGLGIRDFVAHVDRTCAGAGIPEWLGEMNAPPGSRARVLERYGNRILHRTRNHTLSWLAGKDIERLSVLRPVGDLIRVDAAPGDAPPGRRPPGRFRRVITRR